MEAYTDFKALKRPSSPNYYLACPADYCNIKPDVVTPIYPVSVARLRVLWLQAIKPEPRWVLLHADNVQLEYVQRSWLFRFPDYISVQLIEMGKERSSLALLSRSKYGHYDFGVNRKRVKRLLERLDVKK